MIEPELDFPKGTLVRALNRAPGRRPFQFKTHKQACGHHGAHTDPLSDGTHDTDSASSTMDDYHDACMSPTMPSDGRISHPAPLLSADTPSAKMGFTSGTPSDLSTQPPLDPDTLKARIRRDLLAPPVPLCPDNAAPWHSSSLPFEIPPKGHAPSLTAGLLERQGFLHQSKFMDNILGSPQYQSKVISLSDLPFAIDHLPHDYNIGKQSVSSCVLINWLDPPSLWPSDIRSRHVQLYLSGSVATSTPNKLVWKSQFACNGCCQRIGPKSEPLDEDWSPEHELEWLIEQRKQPKEANDTPNGPTSHTCNAVMLITMTAEQVANKTCTLTTAREEYHPAPSSTSVLRSSYHLRSVLHELAGVFGTTEMTLKRRWHQDILPLHPYAQHLSDVTWRIPGDVDIATAVRTAQKRNQIAADPLLGIRIMANRANEAFLHIDCDDFFAASKGFQGKTKVDPAIRLECIIATPFGLQNAILFALKHGIFMDSSWRNKNENGLPMTILCTTNDYGRMVPIAVMLSRHADTRAYEIFLSTVRAHVEQEAARCLADKSRCKYIGMSKRLAKYSLIITEDGFVPRMLMIDRCDSERSAGETTWPGLPVRVCQFHFMQDVRAYLRGVFPSTRKGKSQIEGVLDAIRRLQRCPSELRWLDFYSTFRIRVNSIDDNPTSWTRIDNYLMRTWFTPRWIDYVLDYGMPPGILRDGVWSTNNYSERAFRTFDRTFLQGVANKRTDKLIQVILFSWFPLYEHTPPKVSRPEPILRHNLLQGYMTWEADRVTALPPSQRPVRFQQWPEFYKVDEGTVRIPNRAAVHFCGIENGTERQYCTCDYFETSGKACVGLWAAKIYRMTCPVKDWEEQAGFLSATTAIDTVRDTLPSEDVIPPSGINYRQDFLEYWQEDFSGLQGMEKMNLDGNEDPKADPNTLRKVDTILRIDSDCDCSEDEIPPFVKSRKRKRHADSQASRVSDSVDSSPKASASSSRGRPKASEPFRTTRRSQKSSLKYRRTSLTETGLRPVGSRNATGRDCWALSLLSVLSRSPEWMERMHRARDLLRTSFPDLMGVLSMFQHCVDTNVSFDSRHFGTVFSNRGLIDDTKSQQDHSEAFQKLVSLLEGVVPFADLFAISINWKVHCPTQESPEFDLTSTEASKDLVLLVHPEMFTSEGGPRHLDTLIEHSLSNTTSQYCDHCTVVQTHKRTGTLQHSSPFLIVSIVWTTDSIGYSSEPVMFTLPPSLSVSTPTKSDAVYDCLGVISHQGATPISGHYVCLIKGSTLWWCLDDERTYPANSLADAFSHGRRPVLVFYRARNFPDRSEPAEIGNLVRHSQRSHKPHTLEDSEQPLSELSRRIQQIRWIGDGRLPIFHLDKVNMKSTVPVKLRNALKKAWETAYAKRLTGLSPAGYLLAGDISTEITPKEYLGRVLGSKWWDGGINWHMATIAREAIERRYKSTEARLVHIFFSHDTSRGPPVASSLREGIPLPTLGRDGSWRKSTTVFVMSSMGGTHFVTGVLFGQQRLGVIYDSVPGEYMSEIFEREWPKFLENRFKWEVENGFAKLEDVEGWLMAPNDQATHKALDWVIQGDNTSCGPLSVAVAAMILQGTPPTWTSMGFKKQEMFKSEGERLRMAWRRFSMSRLCQGLSEGNSWLDSDIRDQLEGIVYPFEAFG